MARPARNEHRTPFRHLRLRPIHHHGPAAGQDIVDLRLGMVVFAEFPRPGRQGGDPGGEVFRGSLRGGEEGCVYEMAAGVVHGGEREGGDCGGVEDEGFDGAGHGEWASGCRGVDEGIFGGIDLYHGFIYCVGRRIAYCGVGFHDLSMILMGRVFGDLHEYGYERLRIVVFRILTGYNDGLEDAKTEG